MRSQKHSSDASCSARAKRAIVPPSFLSITYSQWVRSKRDRIRVIERIGLWRFGLRWLARFLPLALIRLPRINSAVPLSALRYLHVRVDPFLFARLQPLDQVLALDGQLRLDVLRRLLVRGLDDQPVDELHFVAHAASKIATHSAIIDSTIGTRSAISCTSSLFSANGTINPPALGW